MFDALIRYVSRGAAAVVLVGALAVDSPAQTAVSMPPRGLVGALDSPGRDVTVSLLTMGNGEQVWELFGHTAIWIHNNATGQDTVFNWGVFDSRQPNFILHFLQGLMLYQMGGETMEQLLYNYRYFNRSVISQELDLSVPQRDSLLGLIRVNARPENLQYRYDYFVDNCSTRPRDLLDRVLGGQLRAHAD